MEDQEAFAGAAPLPALHHVAGKGWVEKGPPNPPKIDRKKVRRARDHKKRVRAQKRHMRRQ